LLDPDGALRTKIIEFVHRGDFGLASGPKLDGSYDRVWFEQPVDPAEVTFDAQVFLLTKLRAIALRQKLAPDAVAVGATAQSPQPGITPSVPSSPTPSVPGIFGVTTPSAPSRVVFRLVGAVTPEVWNRIGIKLLPKLRNGQHLRLGIDFACETDSDSAASFQSELQQALADLHLADTVRLTVESSL
jgi:hypothetical protein